jgi:hypothetical protein
MKKKIIILAVTAAIAAPMVGISLSQLHASTQSFMVCQFGCHSDDDCTNPLGKCPVCSGGTPIIPGQCEDVH